MAILSGKVGGVVASTLHTAGALAFLGGLVAYVVWARAARRGARHPDLLVLGATITYVGILANLFGGFVRTYQPGHPKFWDFGSEPWATVMVIKHAFLFAGMGAAVYLYEVQAPRLAKTQLEHVGRMERLAVWGAAAAIFVASVLGAVAAVTPIGGMMDVDDGNGEPPLPDPFAGAAHRFHGSITGGPLGGVVPPATGTFLVPEGARGLEAVLTLDRPATVTLTLRAPDGDTEFDSTDAQDTVPTASVSLPAAAAGTWEYTVSASTAVAAEWDLVVTLEGAFEEFVEDTVEVAPGEEATLSIHVPGGRSFTWDWGSSDHVGFTIRADGQMLFEPRHTRGESGNLTASSQTTYTLAWANDEDELVSLHYRVWGDFEVA